MNLHNINVISHYEVKLLKRSWLFRIFAILALLVITAVILINQTSVLNQYGDTWKKIALSSMMPFMATYCYNVAQSVIVIFLAGSFLKRDKKLDTAEVIYVRPMSNADYIIGKTWGIVQAFIFLNIIILAITAFFNVFINRSPFDIFPYVFYLLTVSVPSLLFTLGLSFTVMCLVKNQAVTFIIMLGIIGTVFFYLSDTLYGVFDFFGVNIPTIFSDITGHASLYLFLFQRLIYFLLGLGLIIFTISLVKRLPHRPWKIIIVNTIGGIFVLASFCTGFLYVFHFQKISNTRDGYIALYDKYNEHPKVYIQKQDLTVETQNKKLTAESRLTVQNNQTLPQNNILLYLNPALKVTSVEEEGKALKFSREQQIILIEKELLPEQQLSLLVKYEGTIDENICYADLEEKDFFDTKLPGFFYRFGKRYAWLENNYTLLTPECLWYPVSVPPVNPQAPYQLEKNFTYYTLTVKNPGDKTVLSQGKADTLEQQIRYTSDIAYPGISLTMADYEKKSVRVDSTDIEVYYFKGHDFFSEPLSLLKDTIATSIENFKNDMEREKERDYPFRKFVLAETPIQFSAETRNWKGYSEYVQPEILFIPERGSTLNCDFKAYKRRYQNWARREGKSETETQIDIFRDFLYWNFQSETISQERNWEKQKVNPHNINPLFFNHTGYVYSDKYPTFDIVLNTMQSTYSRMNSWWGNTVDNQQKANIYLYEKSFKQASEDTELEPEIFYEVLKLKSHFLKNYIISQSSEKEFNHFLKDFNEQNPFRSISFEEFNAELFATLGVDLNNVMDAWYYQDHSPAILIKDVDANKIVVEDVTKYQVRFKIYNSSDVDALITTETGEMRGRGGWGGDNEDSKGNYIIPAEQALEIRMVCDNQPNRLLINTNISHNLPTLRSYNFPKIDNTIQDTTAGTFVISKSAFDPDPNEIIVDNEDKGFRTIASNSRHKLKDFFRKEEKERYKNFVPWRMPSQWTATAGSFCYGETVNSAVYKSKGSGANSVVWTAYIPQDRYYEAFVWNPKISFRMYGRDRRKDKERIQIYTIRYGEEQEEVSLDLDQEDEGWISLGNYYLPKGETTITLTDRVSGDYVIADAVKFTAIKE